MEVQLDSILTTIIPSCLHNRYIVSSGLENTKQVWYPTPDKWLSYVIWQYKQITAVFQLLFKLEVPHLGKHLLTNNNHPSF